MTAVNVAFLCVAAALACAVVRTSRPEIAFAVALAAGAAALVMLRGELQSAISIISDLSANTEFSAGSTGLLLRAAGVALISEFGAQICRDAGESALAGRIDLAARVVLLTMSAPLIGDVLALVSDLIV